MPSIPTTVTLAGATLAQAAEPPPVQELIERIKSPNDSVRGPAWQNAGPCGAPAASPLADLMIHEDAEVARAAKRALWQIVRHAGRPGAGPEKRAVADALVSLLARPSVPVRCEVVWMLSEIGEEECVAPVAALLDDKAVREDARMALERLPCQRAVQALQDALKKVPEDFRANVAHSLRVRGVAVEGYPSQKLVPTRPRRVELPA